MVIHIVSEGETIADIARIYGVSQQRIISDNAITYPQNLVVGQALLILIPRVIHTVSPGETLTSISREYGIPEVEILQNNPFLIERAPTLYAGEQIVIEYDMQKRRTVSFNSYVYPFIDRDVLVRQLPFLTYLTIFGYGFTDEGELIEPDDMSIIDLAYTYGVAPILLLSSITEDGNFSSEKATRLFNDRVLQDKVLDALIEVMYEKGYTGIDIDFEYVDKSDEQAFLSFLENVRQKMQANGFFLNTDLAPKTDASQTGLLYEAHNYPEVGRISDTVLLMTYEWGYTYGPPMAVAPINKVREVVRYGVSEIPVQKIRMGLPNYGYDWPLPFEKGTTKATSIGNEQAVAIARINGARIEYDQTAQSPFFEYIDYEGIKHVVWFEDVRSMLAKYDLMDEYSLSGGGYWNGMRPFAQNWSLVSALYKIEKII